MLNKNLDKNKIISMILDNNLNFAKTHSEEYFSSFQDSQQPIITLVSCSDSRVQNNVLSPDATNQIFTIENIGNQILPSEGSVDYGILHLKTPLLIILGHSDCGAIKAFMGGYENEKESIKNDLDFLQPALKNLPNELTPENILKNIIANIHYQVKIASQKYSRQIQSKELAIVGAFYDFTNELHHGYGKINIINQNFG